MLDFIKDRLIAEEFKGWPQHRTDVEVQMFKWIKIKFI